MRTRWVMAALVPIMVFGLSGCSSFHGAGSPGSREQAPEPMGNSSGRQTTMHSVRPEIILQTLYSNIRSAEHRVIRDEGALTEFWKGLSNGTNREPPLPAVDFSKEIVVAACLGTRPTGGYSVEFTGVETDGAHAIVHLRETRPRPGAMVIQSLTQPCTAVRLPLAGQTIKLVVDPPG